VTLSPAGRPRLWEVRPPGEDVDVVSLERGASALMSSTTRTGLTTALLAVHRGHIVCERYGEGHDETSTFISWSMAKSMVGALCGVAIEEGLLSLDAPAPVAAWVNDERRTITVRHLLQMTSGLSWIEDYVDGETSHVIDMLFGTGADDVADYATRRPSQFRPGDQWLYSSGTTNILCRLLGDALGDSRGSHKYIESYLRHRLFDAIGMSSAIPKFDAYGTFIGSSYVYATARDFARFGELFLNNGEWMGRQVVPRNWVDFSRESVAHDGDNGFDYGAHWWMWPEERDSLVALGYEGQYIWVLPQRDLVLVRVGKTDAALRNDLTADLLSLVRAFPESSHLMDKSGGRG
jgi:CubicO group peptidase (beta-lactamase class C family)